MATSDKVKIEVGDILRLSSHPTKFMTAHSIDGNFVECVWTNQSGEVIFRNFAANELELVSKKGTTGEALKQ